MNTAVERHPVEFIQRVAIGRNSGTKIGQRKKDTSHHCTTSIAMARVDSKRTDSLMVVHIVDNDTRQLGGIMVLVEYFPCECCGIHLSKNDK